MLKFSCNTLLVVAKCYISRDTIHNEDESFSSIKIWMHYSAHFLFFSCKIMILVDLMVTTIADRSYTLAHLFKWNLNEQKRNRTEKKLNSVPFSRSMCRASQRVSFRRVTLIFPILKRNVLNVIKRISPTTHFSAFGRIGCFTFKVLLPYLAVPLTIKW